MFAPALARTLSSRPPSVRFGGTVPLKPLAAFIRWYDRWLQRRALAELDDRMLRDIGVTRRQALRESRKPFWR